MENKTYVRKTIAKADIVEKMHAQLCAMVKDMIMALDWYMRDVSCPHGKNAGKRDKQKLEYAVNAYYKRDIQLKNTRKTLATLCQELGIMTSLQFLRESRERINHAMWWEIRKYKMDEKNNWIKPWEKWEYAENETWKWATDFMEQCRKDIERHK